MKKKTLLQKAKKIKVKPRISIGTTDEEMELAIAWLKEEIGTRQVAEAIAEPQVGGRVLYRLSVWLREAHRRGKLRIKKP